MSSATLGSGARPETVEDPVAAAVPRVAVVGGAGVGLLRVPLADEGQAVPGVVVGAALIAAREVAAAPLDVHEEADQADVVGARL